MIFEFGSYRNYLKEVLGERIARNPKYSLRAMAKQLGISSSSLSQVMNGHMGFGRTTARRLGPVLGLNGHETEYFCALVELEAEKDPEARAALMQRLRELHPRPATLQDFGTDRFREVSEWYHAAILELALIKDFKMDPSNIASRLYITKMEAKLGLDRLVRLGLLELQGGRFRRVENNLIVRGPAAPEALRKSYLQILDKLRDAVQTQGNPERVSGFETVSFAKSRVPAAMQAIEECFQKIVRLSNEGADVNEDVYHLAIHFFNLTPPQENERNPSHEDPQEAL